MEIQPFTVEHYRRIIKQPAQEYVGEFITEDHVKALIKHDAFAAIMPDGKVLGAAGLHCDVDGRATVWALLSPSVEPKLFLKIHRTAERYLAVQPYRRIEATVDCDFKEGHRWALALGFELEAERMRKYDPAGRDHSLYARVA